MISLFKAAMPEGFKEGWVTCRYRLGIHYPANSTGGLPISTVWFKWKTTQVLVQALPKGLLLTGKGHPSIECRQGIEGNTIQWKSVTDHVYYFQVDLTVAPVWFGTDLRNVS